MAIDGGHETEDPDHWHEQQRQQEEQEAEEAAAGPRVPEPTYDPDMVPGVVTGEDVVAFYGKFGQDSAVKFFYCVR